VRIFLPPKEKRSNGLLYQELGNRLRAHREQLGMTQSEVARRMKLSRPSVVNIEAGRQAVSVAQLVRFVSILKSSYGDLLP
jgi:transcriptional regulator with XRE-family HTH domain